jgi:SAM-dependent methyltransferase
MANSPHTVDSVDTPAARAPGHVTKRTTPAARMVQLARLARARGHLWTAFYNLYAAAVVEGDPGAGRQLAEVLNSLHAAQPMAEVEEALVLALRTPWARPASLTRTIVDYLMLESSVEQVAEGINLSTDDLDAAIDHLSRNQLFATLLQTSVASDLRLERLLMFLRDHLLAVAPATPGAMRLAALIATQAYLVEYLWPYTVGPVDEPNQDGTLPPITSARALLNSMFRAPGAAEIVAIEAVAVDQAISCLLERVRDEPLSHTRYRDEIEAAAVSLGTSAIDPRGGPRPCPRWVNEPSAARVLPLAVQRRLRARRSGSGEMLVVGCGTGQDLLAISATYPQAHVTALDPSVEKLAYAAHKCAQAGLQKIGFLPGALLDVPALGWTFDVIECLAVQDHSPDPDFGCEALARCTRPGSLLRVAIHSDATRRLVGALRHARETCGLTSGLADLRRFRAELLEGRHGALPPALLRSPAFYTASGLRDLLFGEEEVAVGTSTWLAMLDQHGFTFLCEEINGELVRHARDAGLRGASTWSIRDYKRFDREDGLAFGSTQFLWFERRLPKR